MEDAEKVAWCKEVICNAGGWVDLHSIRLGMVAQPWSQDLKIAVRYLMDEHQYFLK